MAAIYHLYLLNHEDTPIFKDTYTSTRFTTSSEPLSSPANAASPTFNDMISALVGTHNRRTSLPMNGEQGAEFHQDVMDLVAHASLDVIEDVQSKSNNMYHKCVDKFNGWSISAFVTPSSTRFVLLHQVKNDDNIRLFFQECWEAYLKTLLNPFYTSTDAIRAPGFQDKLVKSARKYL